MELLLKHKFEVELNKFNGKFRSIISYFERENFTVITDNSEFIDLFEKYNICSGINPFYEYPTMSCLYGIFSDGTDEGIEYAESFCNRPISELIDILKDKEFETIKKSL